MTKIGILLCDGTYPEIREALGSYENCFLDMLNDMGYEFSDHKIWSCYTGEFPEHIDEADIYIISGSKYSAYEPFDWITTLKNLIIKLDQNNKKLLGFCFGHQVIHEALGGKVELSPKGWGLGAYPIYIQHNFAKLKPNDEIRILAMHQDQVMKIADDFDILGSSPFCPHGITKKNEHILTFQSHPEFQNQWFSMLCERIRMRAGCELVHKAALSLNQQHNKNGVLQAIYDFLPHRQNSNS